MISCAVILSGLFTLHAAITETDFGKMPEGRTAHLYTLVNKGGVEARVTDYGGILVSLRTPDKRGAIADIVLGFDALDGYLKNSGPYFGALIGRYASRIGRAKFALNGKTYNVPKNDGSNTLHGEPRASISASGPPGCSPMAASNSPMSVKTVKKVIPALLRPLWFTILATPTSSA